LTEHYINIHTHRKARYAEELAIRNAYHRDTNLNYPVSCGLHPWLIDRYYSLELMEVIEQNLKQENVWAIGECGLDKAIKTDLELQKNILQTHVNWAEKIGKPLIIHCVRAYNELQHFIKNSQAIFLLHGYKGSDKQSKQLLKFDNVYFSFGKRLFQADEGYIKSIKTIPLERTILETDNSNYNIKEIYKQYALYKEIDEEVIKKQLYITFADIFKLNLT
jgi:TatD DNase family protein